jgi:hypothetical protein
MVAHDQQRTMLGKVLEVVDLGPGEKGDQEAAGASEQPPGQSATGIFDGIG